VLKNTNRQFSSLNYKNFEFFCLVPRSPTHTGLICEKTLKPNISSLGPFKVIVNKEKIKRVVNTGIARNSGEGEGWKLFHLGEQHCRKNSGNCS
jgi:hypothetical protein